MKLAFPPLFRGWRAALVLVVAACAIPQRATAGCGDYVTIRNVSDLPNHQSGMVETDSHLPAKMPCHGPNCSEAPARQQAPLAPVSPVESQVKEVVQSFLALYLPVESPHGFNRDCSSPLPIRGTSFIFHPPRNG
jgi:hypothetical protein